MFALIKFCLLLPLYIAYYFFKLCFDILKIIFDSKIETDLSAIDSMNGVQFENYVAKLLRYMQFSNVKITKATGDFGADIIAVKNKFKYAIQCKRYSNKVSSEPIGEVLRGMRKYNCTRGIVVTNNYFTKQAIEEAKICNVELWDRNTIKTIINQYKPNDKKYVNNDSTNSTNTRINANIKKTNPKSNIQLEKLNYNDYKTTAINIQKIFDGLGFNVRVVNIITTKKYITQYECIHELNDYYKLIESNAYERFLKILNIENFTVKEIDKKHFTITVPLRMVNI